MDQTDKDPRIGNVLGDRYRVLEHLAQGSMGSVYRGEQAQLGKPVAIKFLRDLFLSDEYTRDRFAREAHAMSKLSHPHCVSVIDYGIDGELPYIVMDYVKGRPLDEIIQQERVAFERGIRIVLQILAGLAHAHKKGIIHRDVKPENVIINIAAGTGEQARIVDFSLAKMSDGNSRSVTGAILGTPAYMSPEQAVGEEVDERTDLYSVGVIIFELFTGQKPFLGKDVTETLNMHLQDAVPTLGERVPDLSFSERIEDIVQKALAKSRDDRFSSAYEMMEALATIPEAGSSGEIVVLEKPISTLDDSVETIDLPPDLTNCTSKATPEDRKMKTASGAGRPANSKRPGSTRTAIVLSGFLVIVLLLILLLGGQWRDLPTNEMGATGQQVAGSQRRRSTAVVSNGTRTPLDHGIEHVKSLIAVGDIDGAISALQKLRASYPYAAEPAYLLGSTFSSKEWWHAAVERYRDAIDLDPSYKKDPILIQNLILALGNNRALLSASSLIVQRIGAHAIPHLKRARADESSLRIRRRVARLLNDMTVPARKSQ